MSIINLKFVLVNVRVSDERLGQCDVYTYSLCPVPFHFPAFCMCNNEVLGGSGGETSYESLNAIPSEIDV